MTARRSGEEGIALVVVMLLMVIMLTTGFALASTVDTQTKVSQAERVRDAAFNLAEAALNAQIFTLSHDWPGLGRAALPYTTCTQATPSTRCPDNASLQAGASLDLTSATWQTSVRDNGAGSAPNFYSDASTQLQPGYDANNDGKVWVRAQATAQGRTRTLVALVRSDQQEEDVPHAALIAGSLSISNNGKKELIRSGGGGVRVRCAPLDAQWSGRSCVGHAVSSASDLASLTMGRLADQISGGTPQYGTPVGPAMTTEARERLKATAIANGTYYAGCPSAAELAAPPIPPPPIPVGKLVYIESGTCSYTSNTQFNSAQAPGALVLAAGSISFGGTSNFYGVVYNANLTNLSGVGVSTQGNAQIVGGVLIDGGAQMQVGSSGLNVVFDLNAYRAVASYGSAGVIQNTWREIKPG
jgi:Tfp pilus assembly protein PilX